MVEAMRAKESLRLETLRSLIALFSNELIAKKSPATFIDDESALAIIKRSANQRKDSIEQFEKGNRQDLVNKEKAELAILKKFLPATMSQNEIRKIIDKKLKVEGPIDTKKIGQFMGAIMKELKGKADGTDVKAVIDEMVK